MHESLFLGLRATIGNDAVLVASIANSKSQIFKVVCVGPCQDLENALLANCLLPCTVAGCMLLKPGLLHLTGKKHLPHRMGCESGLLANLSPERVLKSTRPYTDPARLVVQANQEHICAQKQYVDLYTSIYHIYISYLCACLCVYTCAKTCKSMVARIRTIQ